MGGAAEAVAGYLAGALRARAPRSREALALAVAALGHTTTTRRAADR